LFILSKVWRPQPNSN